MTPQEAKNRFDNFGKTLTLDEARKDVHILIDEIFKNKVYIVEYAQNMEYGEYMGIHGIYTNKEDAEKLSEKLSNDDYNYWVSEYELNNP